MSVIEIESLRKEYSVPGGTEVAVRDIDLEIEEGDFFTIVGPSGCGKTTTLRCIAGLETPTSGAIRFDGRDVTSIPTNKRDIAMMFQSIALYPHMTIRENIQYPLKLRHMNKAERDEETERVAEIVQIPELLDKYPGELSGGQRQRAALARTIIQDPLVFLMDEPLSDLDAKLKVEMRKVIQRIHKRLGKPTIYVTHDQEEALTMSTRIAVMNDGNVEQVGTPDELYEQPANLFVADFIGNPSMNFIPGHVASVSDGEATIQGSDGSISFSVDNLPASYEGEDVTVGFRPEDGRISTDRSQGIYEAEVILLERIDDRSLVYIEGPDDDIRATIPSDTSITEDEPVSLSVDGEDVYLFDGSGDLIRREKEPVLSEGA
ncbi:ABC transporter ATP-binding protein [Halorussus salinisoli]|uniref:ABC transporter ATP-binding protein n=1 Tax=Halorussus salinisoli TaxID=2558242 RepID=UPI0010C22A96|nr:ABC transporter ATP-binding protein [Halorussus salinisoli]